MSNIPPFQQLDPRVQRTMNLLYGTFVEILKTKHYKYIKVLDITKAAGINRATFYNHFGKMEEFIIFCAREGFRREIYEKFSPQNMNFSIENFQMIVHWVFAFMAREYSLWHFQWDEFMFEQAVRTEFYYYLVAWIPGHKKYLDSPSFNDTSIMLVSAAVIGLGITWCENNCQEPITEITPHIVEFLSPGLSKIAG
jgi:AcrR family transcriptional regulator